jgi:hypothetical protein
MRYQQEQLRNKWMNWRPVKHLSRKDYNPAPVVLVATLDVFFLPQKQNSPLKHDVIRLASILRYHVHHSPKGVSVQKTLFFFLLMTVVFSHGCSFFEECPTSDYCEDNEYWSATGTEHLGCDNEFVKDCSLSGQVCHEAIAHNDAGCFFEDTKCDVGIGSYCEGDELVLCEAEGNYSVDGSVRNLGVYKTDCSDAGLVCATDQASARCTLPCDVDDSECVPANEKLFWLVSDDSWWRQEEWSIVNAAEEDLMYCRDGYWRLVTDCNFLDTDTTTDTTVDTDYNIYTDSDTNNDTTP